MVRKGGAKEIMGLDSMEEVRALRIRLKKALILIHNQVSAIKELTETNEHQAKEVNKN